MKYLVAATAADLDADVHKRFGHAEAFLVVDSETFEYSAFSGVGHDEPHHGIARFEGKGIERVIVGNIGPGAFQDVCEMGWEIYLCRSMTVREAIERVNSGAISPLKQPTMKHSIHEGQEHGSHGKSSHGSRRRKNHD